MLLLAIAFLSFLGSISAYSCYSCISDAGLLIEDKNLTDSIDLIFKRRFLDFSTSDYGKFSKTAVCGQSKATKTCKYQEECYQLTAKSSEGSRSL